MVVPRTLLPIEVEQAVDTIRSSLSSFLGVKDVDLVDSVMWYRDVFGRCGTWESWVWDTVLGRDYGTRERHFDGFVVFGRRLGRAGASIVDLALRSNRAVLTILPERGVEIVQSVVQTDNTDMITGWEISSSPVISGDSHD